MTTFDLLWVYFESNVDLKYLNLSKEVDSRFYVYPAEPGIRPTIRSYYSY